MKCIYAISNIKNDVILFYMRSFVLVGCLIAQIAPIAKTLTNWNYYGASPMASMAAAGSLEASASEGCTVSPCARLMMSS